MDFIAQINAFAPQCAQEANDQKVILWYARRFGESILTRENEIAHITCSGFLMNAPLSKVLMVHHNIRDTWAWTGGHADGDADFLSVAMREAMEETGIRRVTPLSDAIASIDILPVFGHMRRGSYVSAHLHLSVAYLLICGESEPLRSKPDENSGVAWFDAAQIVAPRFDFRDVKLYHKLMDKARCV